MTAAEVPRLPFRVKAGYGAAEIGMSGVEVTLQLYLLLYYTQYAGLSPSLAGIAIGLALFWDAVSDPLMGVITDHTRTRWGQRIPYIAVGAFGLAGSLVLLFHPPTGAGDAGLFGYLLGCTLLLNTAMTLMAVPHAALGSALSPDPHERTVLFGWRLFFRNVGFMAGTLVPGALYGGMLSEAQRTGGNTASWVLAGLVVASAAVTVGMVRERRWTGHVGVRAQQAMRWNPFVLWEVMKNRVFLPLLLAFVIASAGRTINSSLAMYYYTQRLGFSEQTTVVRVLLPFMGVISVSIVAWVLLGKRYGKKLPAFWGALCLGLLTMVMYPLFPIGELLPVILFASILGGFLVASVVLFDALVADIVDYDTLRSGERREGLYYGAWTMATKLSRAVGIGLTGLMLEAIGLEAGAVAGPEVTYRVTLLFGPGVGGFFVVAALVFLWMPLTPEKHAQVQRILAKQGERADWRQKNDLKEGG